MPVSVDHVRIRTSLPLLVPSAVADWKFDGPTVIVLISILHVILALWVRYDAEKRGMDSDKWMAAVLIPTIGLFGLVVYLSERRSEGAD